MENKPAKVVPKPPVKRNVLMPCQKVAGKAPNQAIELKKEESYI